MKRLFFIAILLSLSGILASCNDTSKRLDAKQLIELLTGDKKGEFTTLRFDGTVAFDADGSAHLSISALGDDDGKWHLDNDQICVKFNEALRKRERCAYLHLNVDGSFSVRNPATNVSLGSLTILN